MPDVVVFELGVGDAVLDLVVAALLVLVVDDAVLALVAAAVVLDLLVLVVHGSVFVDAVEALEELNFRVLALHHFASCPKSLVL